MIAMNTFSQNMTTKAAIGNTTKKATKNAKANNKNGMITLVVLVPCLLDTDLCVWCSLRA